MECIIPGANLKVLGKALQALSKIGDEIYMESRRDKLSFITLNSSKTVCARFHFLDNFFSSYEINEADLKKATNETLTCKVHMKVFLPLFKGNVEKKLDFCKFEYENDSDFIVFKMKYRCDDIVMLHQLRLMDNETLSIGVATDGGPNNMGASSAVYTQLLSMFNTTDDEITFEITTGKVIARNYCLGSQCRPKMMRSQINLGPTEFITYRITTETTLNFALKPFRTVISFAEIFNLNIEFNFDVGGKPLTIILRNPTFEVHFIVATLNPYNDANTSVTSNTVASKIQPPARDSPIPEDDLLAMATVNWSNSPPGSKDSSFGEIAKIDQIPEDVVPNSPESPRTKRAKMVFGRCFDPTFCETKMGAVLAANSDSE